MNAYEKSIELGLAGTTVEILAVVNKLTARPIPSDKLRHYLRINGLLIFGRTITGKIVAAPISLIDVLVDVLTDPDTKEIRTDSDEWGPSFSDSLDYLVSEEYVTAEQRDAVMEIGGGQPYSTTTAEKFEHQKTGVRIYNANNIEILPDTSVIIAPVENIDAARQIASDYLRTVENVSDWQVENMLTVPMSVSGVVPVTHYVCVRNVNTDNRDAMVQYIAGQNLAWCADQYYDDVGPLDRFHVANSLGGLKEIG